jgi:DeoR/GlpR family transcriptional regulator of sugar metabolism
MDVDSEGFVRSDVMARCRQASESTVKRTLQDLETMGFLWREEGGQVWFLDSDF